MEKEIIPLKVKLKYMVGIRFDSMKHMWNGATVARGWYLFFGFYWFCFGFFKKWPSSPTARCATGFFFSYKPNPTTQEGDLMWLKNKRYLRFDYPEETRHAQKI